MIDHTLSADCACKPTVEQVPGGGRWRRSALWRRGRRRGATPTHDSVQIPTDARAAAVFVDGCQSEHSPASNPECNMRPAEAREQ